MNQLFMPKELEKMDLLGLGKPKVLDERIIFASGDRIYWIPDFDSKPQKFKDRCPPGVANKHHIHALCCYKNTLYDAWGFSIFENLSDIPIVTRPETVYALEHNGSFLYDAGDYSAVYETLESKEIHPFGPRIHQLISHRCNLLAVCAGSVFNVANGAMYEAGKTFTSACSLDRTLYFATDNGSSNLFYSEHNDNGGSRDDRKVRLFSYKHKLYDVSCSKGIIRNNFDENFSYDVGMPVNDIITISADKLEDLLT